MSYLLWGVATVGWGSGRERGEGRAVFLARALRPVIKVLLLHTQWGCKEAERNGLHLGVWTPLGVRFPMTAPLVWWPQTGGLGIRVAWVL